MGTSYYHIADTSEVDKMKSLLLHTFESMAEVEDTTTSRFFDTFDWRLHQKGWQLYRQNRHYEIVDQATEKIVTAVGVNDAKKRTFYWDFPDSRFSEILGQTTQMRALLPVADIVRERLRLHLRNGDEKIVARIDIETYGDKENTTTVMRCRPNPVRGYKKELRRVISVIEALSLPEENKNPVLAILERGERHPGDYSSKINIDLQPEMAANQAVRLIMRNLVDVMHINLPGVLDDIDSEFLHDFRVSIRRARSLLGQMKAVLDAETTAALQSRLKTMGGATGEVRDLDVYLLKKSEYTQLVPETLDKGIVQLFQILERKRRYAKKPNGQSHGRKRFCRCTEGIGHFFPKRSGSRPDFGQRISRRPPSHNGRGKENHIQTIPPGYQEGSRNFGNNGGRKTSRPSHRLQKAPLSAGVFFLPLSRRSDESADQAA